MANLGALDFAGGSPVHISSGTAALAISLFLGRRRGYGTDALAYRPANVGFIVLGTALIWFAWFGFNAGSALGANLRSVQVAVVTFLSASMGGITWVSGRACAALPPQQLTSLPPAPA
jgi:Amt family ammonium transporter